MEGEVVDKVRRKLATWKGKKLTFVGRVCMIKSVFIAIQLYYLSLFNELAKKVYVGVGCQ